MKKIHNKSAQVAALFGLHANMISNRKINQYTLFRITIRKYSKNKEYWENRKYREIWNTGKKWNIVKYTKFKI